MRSTTRRHRTQALTTTRRVLVLGFALVLVGAAAEVRQTLEADRLPPAHAAAEPTPSDGSPSATNPAGSTTSPRGSGPIGSSSPSPDATPGLVPQASAPSVTTAVPDVSRSTPASQSASRSATRTAPPTTSPEPSETETSGPTKGPRSPSPKPKPSPKPSPSEDDDDSMLGGLFDFLGNGERTTG